MPRSARLRREAGGLKRAVRAAGALAMLVLAGCSASIRGEADLTSSRPSSGAAVGIEIRHASGFAALLGLGALAAGASAAPTASREPPPLSEARRVSVQDCTRPLGDNTGNLSCR